MNRLRRILSRTLDTQRIILLATALNAPLLAILLLRNVGGMPSSALGSFYLSGVVLGYYVLPLMVVSIALGWFLSAWRRTSLVVAGAVLALFQFFVLIDGQVYSVYKFHLDAFWLNFLVRDFAGLGIPFSLVALTVSALALVVAFELWVFRSVAGWHLRRWTIAALPGLLVLGFVSSQILHIVAYEKNDARITSLTPHLPLYMPVSSHRNAVQYGDLLAVVAAGTDQSPEVSASLHYPLEELRFASPPHGAADRPNILVVLLESWRADTWGPQISPNVHALAERSTVFEQHFSSGNSTVAGIFGLFYGIHPTYWNAVKAQNVRIANPVLIDALQAQRYAFGIFADSEFRRHKIEATVFQGIEVHDEFEGRTVVERDRALTQRVIEFVERQQGAPDPFFALAFYKASHFDYDYEAESAPFQPARKLNLALLDGKRDPEYFLNDYRNAVHFDDALIGGLLARMEALGLMDETIIVVTSDHAESFNDNGANYWGHGSNFTRFQTQVPFILYVPGRAPQRVSTVTSHLDVAPTLLTEVLGCLSDVSVYSDGVNLFGALPPSRPLLIASYFNHALVIGQDVYESHPLGMKSYRLDDVTLPASDPDPRLLRTFMRELARFHVPQSWAQSLPPTPDPVDFEPVRASVTPPLPSVDRAPARNTPAGSSRSAMRDEGRE